MYLHDFYVEYDAQGWGLLCPMFLAIAILTAVTAIVIWRRKQK